MKGIPWKGAYIDGRRWWVLEQEFWTSIVHRLWIQIEGSCSMVGSTEVNCLWIENTLNSEPWTLNPELWTLNPELWTLNPGRGSCLVVYLIQRCWRCWRCWRSLGMDITCCYNCWRIKLTIYGSTLLEILRELILPVHYWWLGIGGSFGWGRRIDGG